MAAWTGSAGAQSQAKPAAPGPADITLQESIDLESVVLGAAKTVTTVQEAPSIVTIVTRVEIRRRGFRTVNEVLDQWVPAFQFVPGTNRAVESTMTRGAVQAALSLRDGISMFDPGFNVLSLGQGLPIELVKRLEVVSGPGGVLWGPTRSSGSLRSRRWTPRI
jgi:iron complex outermembrane receptor protein